MIQWPLSQFKAGKLKLPAKVAPASSSTVSPQYTLFKADCRSPPDLTLITEPGAGVSAMELATVAIGSSAGPSYPLTEEELPKLPLIGLLLAPIT
jgi:hypothetical protein